MMKRQVRNRGFSLVELIVGIAIAAIVSGMVLTIVQFSSNSFRSTTAEESAQQQAQTVTSQINDYIMNTKDAVCYYVEDQMVSNDQNYEDVTPGATNDLDAVEKKQIVLYDKVGTDIKETRIEWIKADQTLFVDEDTADSKPAVLLAQNINDFSVDLKDAFTHKKIVLQIRIMSDKKIYAVDRKTINLRNQLLINQTPVGDGSGEFTKTITGTKVTASSNRILPSASVAIHGTVQANYSVSQACRYYILLDDNTIVSNISGYCSINESTGELRAESYIRENKEIVVIAYPVVVMDSTTYSDSEKLALAGTMSISIVTNAITSTQVVGPTKVTAGETIQYSATVSGYPGVSQDCKFTMKYNGTEVTSLDGGNVTINSNGELICNSALSNDFTVEIIAIPLEIYNSDLPDAEKQSLSGKLNVLLQKKAAVVPQLVFVTPKSTMYTGQRSIFTVAETHGFSLSNISFSIVSGGANASVNSSTGQVTVNAGAGAGSTFKVKATAYYGTVLLSTEEALVTVLKPNFSLWYSGGELTQVEADFTKKGQNYNPRDRYYSLWVQLDNHAIANGSSVSGTLTTTYSTNKTPFYGISNNDSYVYESINVSSPSISFSTYDYYKKSLSTNTCNLDVNLTITLSDGTRGTIIKSIPYRKNIL
jgi:prepilin-type N-terminal cleavage/methylation domain-containing protein